MAGAARLIGGGAKPQAAKRMMSAAAVHGIDLSLMWGTVDRGPDGRPVRVREVCLGVPGAGKTVVLLLGEPLARADMGHAERVACIESACVGMATLGTATLAQSLPDPAHAWAVGAFEDAGFTRVGELATMRRGVEPVTSPLESAWPAGVEVRVVQGRQGRPTDADRLLLIEALNRTYIDTLDCPELCGLRATSDVLDSHLSTGEWDPRLWWIVLWNGAPHGCLLFNRVPEQSTVELVYLGLSPELRGRGVGKLLVALGLSTALRAAAVQVVCAVDLRNAPARKLYGRFGFREAGHRLAMVKPLTRA